MAKLYRIAVTGHRNLGDKATVQFVAQAFQNLLAQAKREHPNEVVALSGLAEGADTLFSEIALQLGVPVDAVIAYQGFIEDFAPGSARERYQKLLAQCQAVHQLPYPRRSDEAYLAVGHWLVAHCDLLVAAWNGRPAAGKGGTGDVVVYAKQQRRPVQHLHTIKHLIQNI